MLHYLKFCFKDENSFDNDGLDLFSKLNVLKVILQTKENTLIYIYIYIYIYIKLGYFMHALLIEPARK